MVSVGVPKTTSTQESETRENKKQYGSSNPFAWGLRLQVYVGFRAPTIQGFLQGSSVAYREDMEILSTL